MTSDRLIQQQPKQMVRRFIRGTVKGLRFFLDKRTRAKVFTALTRVTAMEPEVAKQTYDFYYGIMTNDGVPSERSLIDDFELSRLMLPKTEIQIHQAERRCMTFACCEKSLKVETEPHRKRRIARRTLMVQQAHHDRFSPAISFDIARHRWL